jgi:tryptophan-rich sensory protein
MGIRTTVWGVQMTIIHWRHLPFSRPKTALVLAILAIEAVGALGGIFTVQSVDTWYQTLTRPALAPPGWVFAPVWTTLFALMGVALYRIWALAREQYAASQAVRWFLAHMILNVGWSAAFFGLESTGAGLAVIRGPRGHRGAVGGDRAARAAVRPPRPARRGAAGAILAVGELRCGAELPAVGAQLSGRR